MNKFIISSDTTCDLPSEYLIDNNVDIPQQGVIYIHNNINKEFVRR